MVFLGLACHVSPKNEAAPPPDTTAADMKRLDALSKETVKMGELTDNLKKLSPLGADELKTRLPESLNDYRRTSVEADTAGGYALAKALYQKAAGVEMLLAVQDCAGENGAAAYSLQYWSALNITNEDEDGYAKTISFNGGKAIEEYKRADQEVSLMWFAADRFLVTLKAKGLNAAVLHQAAQEVNF